jgi:purine-binding chemotaxis protein CheW
MAVGIDLNGESYGLIIDTVGEVLKLHENSREPVPINLDARLAQVTAAVHRLDGELLVVLDVARVLDVKPRDIAA